MLACSGEVVVGAARASEARVARRRVLGESIVVVYVVLGRVYLVSVYIDLLRSVKKGQVFRDDVSRKINRFLSGVDYIEIYALSSLLWIIKDDY